MNKTGMLRTVLGLAAIAGMTTGIGCGGRGAYTREGTSLAKEKMNVIKSATEWDMARQAFLAGDLDKALRKIDVSLGINPGVAKSHVLRGRILLEMGEMGLAQQSLQTALATDPDHIEGHYYMGIVAERLAKTQDAFDHYNRAAELDEYNDQYAVAAAEMLIDMNRYSEASDYLHATPSFNHSAGVRQTLGHLARLQGNLPQAVAEFRSSQLLAPDDLGILEDLTRAQFDSGAFADSAYGFSTLLSRTETSDRRDLKRLYADCLIRINRPMEARKIYKDLTSSAEGASDVDAWIGLGNVSYAVGDFTSVRHAATRAVALAPTRKDGYVLWSLLHRNQGNMEASIKSLRDAIARDQSDPMLHTMLALGLMELNRPTEARQALAQALTIDPANISAATVMSLIDEAVAGVETDR